MAERVSLSPNFSISRISYDVLDEDGESKPCFGTYRNRNCVVFIDNWNDTHGEELREGILSVQILGTIGYIIPCKEYLRDGLMSVIEELIPESNELALSDAGQSLL